jgi:hypothetical protein
MKWIVFSVTFISQLAVAQLPNSELVSQRPDINGIVVLPDGRKCRGVIEVNAQGKEYTRLIECEGVILQGQQFPTKNTEAKQKKSQGFDVEDGEAHYAVKFGYSLDPKGAFTNVIVGNTQTKADITYQTMPTLELEYGFYNKYAWNFIAGAGIDFNKKAKSTKYNFDGTVTPQPTMNFSSLNIYLNLYRAFERFYIQFAGLYAITQVTFDSAKSSEGAGGLGYRLETGYAINSRWAIYGSYRSFELSAKSIANNNNNFNFSGGTYSDFLIGARYLFR